MQIRPIKPRRISSQVFEQIRELIYKGVFKSGQQIPTERDLAASMEVSRTSVRNAIERLVGHGLLTQIQGRGTFVCSPESRSNNPLATMMDTNDATCFDLLEVRMGLECNAARIAASRATDSDLHNMHKSLIEMEEDLAATETITTTADTAFHMAVTFSTKNPVLIHMTRNFYDFLFTGIKKNLVHMKEDAVAYKDVLSHHREVYQYIKERAPEKAHDAMQSHLVYAQNFFEQHHATLVSMPTPKLIS